MSFKIALTGATGFAGQHVLPALLARGHDVRILARGRRRVAPAPRLEIFEGDLRQPASLASFAAGADVIVNLAGVVSARNRQEFFVTNADGVKFLAEAGRAAGVRRIIHVSSLSARSPELSAYGASKHAGEQFLKDLATAIILRPPAIYGQGDKATLPLIKQLVSPIALIPSREDNRFSLIHVQDLAEIIADLVGNGRGGLLDVDDGKAGGYQWQDLVDISRKVEGQPRKVIFLPRVASLAVASAVAPLTLILPNAPMISLGKVRELYHQDWVCSDSLTARQPIGFSEGLVRTLAWYREQGWLPHRRNADRTTISRNHGEPTK